MKTITVANQKGGCSKTTTSAALATGLSYLKGYRVLSVDLDPQTNLSFNFGAKTDRATVSDLLYDDKVRVKTTEAIQHTEVGDIIAAAEDLAVADSNIEEIGREYRLREALEEIQDMYDYCVIDTPPALSILTVNALVACDTVIIPAQADIYSLQGIEKLATKTIAPIRKYSNPTLRISGILLTRHSSRSVISRDMADVAAQLATRLGTRLFETTIREAVVVKEAQVSRQPIYTYAPKASVTSDFIAFIEEFLDGGKNYGTK